MIEDVIKNVRESFLNEGVDEQVLHELKQVSVALVKPKALITGNWLQIIVFVKTYSTKLERDVSMNSNAREVFQS